MAKVEVAISGVQVEKRGVLLVILFDKPEDYLKKAMKTLTVKPETTTVTFDAVPKGTYSVSVVHDVNENGQLDRNWLGIPKEPFGFSKKSMGLFGPPSFKDTSFDVADEDKKVDVKVISLF
mmetsp:Transcript_27358/g.88364  ORF Transcript_27358/g.88364 Transcript_27358/m.88364 type:complete len:121 (-) Transcript_27358:134-496(-)